MDEVDAAIEAAIWDRYGTLGALAKEWRDAGEYDGLKESVLRKMRAGG